MTMEVAHGMVVAKIRSFSSFMMHNCAGELWKQVEFFILCMEKMFTAAPKAINHNLMMIDMRNQPSTLATLFQAKHIIYINENNKCSLV
ncbi:hypothetical protein T06_10275 [Trichinella sp. T6]|nr:hypothetical protein T06_10275 [Trichinella sp. T6]